MTDFARLNRRILPTLALVLGLLPGAGVAEEARLPLAFYRLRSLHPPMPEPRPGDWLAQHDEPGQTYAEWVTQRPNRVGRQRRLIYLQPLGPLDEKQREVFDLTADYMRAFFQLPVRTRPPLPMNLVDEQWRRVHPLWRVKQINSAKVLTDVLVPRVPRDACAYLVLTASDLWPGAGWNYVFGQATYRRRVGIWSMHRLGDPVDEFETCLRRTLSVATHETGHMFSMLHCTAHPCNMNGSNHLAESDRQPMWLCPQCAAKLCEATDADPEQRCRELIRFFEKVEFDEEARFQRSSLAAMRGSR